MRTAGTGGLTAFGATTLAGNASAHEAIDIPPRYLEQYRETGTNWGMDWTYLAGIGAVETQHGQYEDGCETSSAGARGPMQFMPSTWEAYGVDGTGDGTADSCDYRDAIPSAANYLEANGAPKNWDDALYAYNPRWSYVEHVKEHAAQYRDRYGSGDGGDGGSGGDGGGDSPAFADGDRVTPTTGLNTRHRPGTESTVLATMQPGSIGEIVNGPETVDGYTWWGIHWLEDDSWGWSVERYLTVADGGGGSEGADFTWPIDGYITSPYGDRPGHLAVDFGNDRIVGTPICAARDGVVDVVGYEADGCGNYVTLGHENGYQTMYCHLNSVAVSDGQHVSRGQQIGGMGDTGRSTAPHLHFTVERNRVQQPIPGDDGRHVIAGEAIPKAYDGL
ncbi:peptidoglycan DD-metalloendopeptidase family protein [Natrinema salaciae]|uniref:peptidoglycan DD-metalloendopeptidase family protein n=1 Tax=Natrinema salaciae TaxID=1186196 RepID=UPI0015870A16|nr:peptidoglycan DD-metalloendopeptidase family protein [Natrinema salaciae]